MGEALIGVTCFVIGAPLTAALMVGSFCAMPTSAKLISVSLAVACGYLENNPAGV